MAEDVVNSLPAQGVSFAPTESSRRVQPSGFAGDPRELSCPEQHSSSLPAGVRTSKILVLAVLENDKLLDEGKEGKLSGKNFV